MDLSYFGLDIRTITDAADTCENLLDEATEIIHQLGTKEEQDAFDKFFLEEEVAARLWKKLDATDISNDIISACCSSVEDLINTSETFQSLGISVESHTDFRGTELNIYSNYMEYVRHDSDLAVVGYCDGELRDVTLETFTDMYAEKLHEQMCSYLKETGKDNYDYSVEMIKEDLRGDADYTLRDVLDSIEQGELASVIKETVDEYSCVKETGKSKIDSVSINPIDPVINDEYMADTIEQYMFERGEYDYKDDTIRWISKGSREETTDNIRQALEDGDLAPLIDYFEAEADLADDEDSKTASEILSQLKGFEDEGKSFDEGYALKKYEDYKYRWTKEHISDADMTATQADYENDPEAEGMTFREYVEEFGFADGSCYVSFDEFVENEFPLYELADDIERAMYENGEYDASPSERLSWIGEDAPIDAVLSSLENDPSSLIDYFEKQLDAEDDRAKRAAECIEKIHTLCDAARQDLPQDKADEKSPAKKKADIDLD